MNNSLTIKPKILFIKSLLHQKTGLACGNEKEFLTSIYKNSLAIMVFLHEKEISAAERIFDIFERYYQLNQENFQGLPKRWNVNTALPDTSSISWEGDSAFLLLSLIYYKAVTGSFGKYKKLVMALRNWLSQRANSCDLISAEGIADTYAALIHFSKNNNLKQALSHLERCFYSKGQVSSADYKNVLCHIIRGTLVFGDVSGFKYLSNFVRSEKCDFDKSINVKAFANFADDSFIDVEISTQVLLALKFKQQKDIQFDTSDLCKEIKKLWIAGAIDPSSIGLPRYVTGRDTNRLFSLPALEPTCFLLFYYWGMNPFRIDG